MDSNTQIALKLMKFQLAFLEFLLLCTSYYLKRKNQRMIRRWWVRPAWRLRHLQGVYHTMMPTMLMSEDLEYFKKYFRMSAAQFKMLCARLAPRLKKYPRSRLPLPPGEQTSIAVRFLATGDSLSTIAMVFRVGLSTAASCFNKVCQVLYEELQPEFLPPPTEETWRRAMDGFENQWQFPCCAGAIDGKHIALKCPTNSGSKFYNYKGYFSLVLMAVVDSNYRFLYVDIGAYGSQSDCGIFRNSTFGDALYNNHLNLPQPSSLNNTNLPCCFVGDSAFQLHRNLMKPYPSQGLNNSRQIYNYRLSHARRCQECLWHSCSKVAGVVTAYSSSSTQCRQDCEGSGSFAQLPTFPCCIHPCRIFRHC